MIRSYRNASLESASGVELIVALYDGLIRFLGQAAAAAERGDVSGRREAARRSFDIIIHLQAVLRPEIGGRPAEALAEFYASIFATILRASMAAAPSQFHHAIRCVRTVREAWQQVAQDPAVTSMMPKNLQTREEKLQSGSREMALPVPFDSVGSAGSGRWTA
jgi:flagellar protein FliS